MIINKLFKQFSIILHFWIFRYISLDLCKSCHLGTGTINGPMVSIWYLYLMNVILYILCVKLNYNYMCCGFSVIAILLRILVIFAYLWRSGRVKPEMKKRLTMYLKTGNLDAGIEKSKSKVRAFTCLHAAVRV